MGSGGRKKPLPEIDDTKSAGRDDAFEAIITRVVDADGEISSDETHPLFIDIGADEFEVGTERIVQFELNRMEFLLTRKVETHRLSGDGRNKHVEENRPSKINISLKTKTPYANDWQVVDLDDMF
jgi:hypothetical protein